MSWAEGIVSTKMWYKFQAEIIESKILENHNDDKW
jgi:hypothetical protein